MSKYSVAELCKLCEPCFLQSTLGTVKLLFNCPNCRISSILIITYTADWQLSLKILSVDN